MGLCDQMMERLIHKLNIPALTRIWMEDNRKLLLRVWFLL